MPTAMGLFVAWLAGFFFSDGSSGVRREIHQFHSVLSLYMRGPVRVLRGGGHFSGCVEETCFEITQLFNSEFIQRWEREQDIAASTSN